MKRPGSAEHVDDPSPNGSDKLPPICNLPTRRNPNFVGRETILSTLAEDLQSGRPLSHRQAIKGMGGIGKTQIALEYAHRYATRYNAIWWLRAEHEKTLAADYASFSVAANLPEKDAQNEKIRIAAVRSWLEQNRNWLLIFDGVSAPDRISDFFPTVEKAGHVLITSRHQMWDKLCRSIGVFFFSRSESIEFLLKQTSREDPSGAKNIAEQLGDLPIALEQAAAYIRQSKVSFKVYLQLYQKRYSALWKEESPPLTYPDSLGTTVRLAVEKAQEKEPGATPLLSLFSYFACAPISFSILTQAKKHLPEQISSLFTDKNSIEKGIDVLDQFALIDTQSEGSSIHSLIQKAVQDHLPAKEKKQWSEVAVTTIAAVFPAKDYHIPELWPKCTALLAHGHVAVENSLTNHVAWDVSADLLDSIGTYFHVRKLYHHAETSFRQALHFYEKQLGENHPHVGAVSNNLASVYQYQERFDEAATCFQRALEIYKTETGEDHLYTAAVMNNLASLLRDQDKIAEAETLLRKAVDIYQKKLGNDDLHIATSINNLAVILLDQGKYDETEQLLQKALDIYETKLGKSHPFVVTGLNNLALFLQDQGSYEKAEPLFRRALHIQQKQLPVNHLDIAHCLTHLAGILYEENEFAEAETFYKKALEILQAIPDDNHCQLAACLVGIAKVLEGLEKYHEAESFFRQALQSKEKTGDNDPGYADHLTLLAGFLHDRGSYAEADTLYRRGLKIYESALDSGHPDLAACVNNLAVSLHEQGKKDDAEPFLRQAMDIYEKSLGSDHPDTAASRHNLSALLKASGRNEEAAKLSEQIPVFFTDSSID